MAKKPENMYPDLIFVGRAKNKVRMKLVILIVEKKDRKGIPRKFRMLLDGENINLEENMEFMTAYIPYKMTLPEE